VKPIRWYFETQLEIATLVAAQTWYDFPRGIQKLELYYGGLPIKAYAKLFSELNFPKYLLIAGADGVRFCVLISAALHLRLNCWYLATMPLKPALCFCRSLRTNQSVCCWAGPRELAL
jgi:hypothetical protein